MKYRVSFLMGLFLFLGYTLSLYSLPGGEWAFAGESFTTMDELWLENGALLSRKEESSLPEEGAFFREGEEISLEIETDEDLILSAPPSGDMGRPQKVPLGKNELVVCFFLFLSGVGVYKGYELKTKS